jgi:SAM-dependent methyltransferase
MATTANNNDDSSSSTPPPAIVGLGTDAATNRSVYNAWAATYQADTQRWGYTLPAQAAAFLAHHVTHVLWSDNDNANDRPVHVWDAGAGNGLTGLALRRLGGRWANLAQCDLTGADVSPVMLQQAAQRPDCYNRTRVLDLNQPLTDMADATYHVVHCMGTLTYLAAASGVLQEFVRIVRPGGFVCYSHRTDQQHLWAETEAALEGSGQWQRVAQLGPLPYLPAHVEYADKVLVVVYLYRVLPVDS